MKTAIYIEDGKTQLVLTPENEWETNCLKLVSDKKQGLEIHSGSFYDCRGGWTRQSTDDTSLIIIVKKDI